MDPAQHALIPLDAHHDVDVPSPDDTSMNGNGGGDLALSPIVVQPGDRQGPTEDMPNRALHIRATVFVERAQHPGHCR